MSVLTSLLQVSFMHGTNSAGSLTSFSFKCLFINTQTVPKVFRRPPALLSLRGPLVLQFLDSTMWNYVNNVKMKLKMLGCGL